MNTFIHKCCAVVFLVAIRTFASGIFQMAPVKPVADNLGGIPIDGIPKQIVGKMVIPVELLKDTLITALKPLSEYGDAYWIVNPEIVAKRFAEGSQRYNVQLGNRWFDLKGRRVTGCQSEKLSNGQLKRNGYYVKR